MSLGICKENAADRTDVARDDYKEDTSEKNNTGLPKAVVFTHFNEIGRIYKGEQTTEGTFISYYEPILRSYLNCGDRIAIVYAYIDWAVKETLPKLKFENGHFVFTDALFQDENRILGLLRKAEAKARDNKLEKPPVFCYIGFRNLPGSIKYRVFKEWKDEN